MPGRFPLARRLLYFVKDGGDVLHPRRFRERYGPDPDGANFYYGVNWAAAERFRASGEALARNHRAFFDMVLAHLLAEELGEFAVNLGLWPFEPGCPYEFVMDARDLLRGVARELEGYQEAARRRGKRLEIVVRYASEMNDPLKDGHPWGRAHGAWDPGHARPFRESFAAVREVFREHAPEIRFAFSPAVRADIAGERYAMIRDFWPGEGVADVVSCTWYAGRGEHVRAAAESLRSYLSEPFAQGMPLGIDEIGGLDGDRDNDCVLWLMLETLGEILGPDRRLEYLTFFLHDRWATDTTLRFLTRDSAAGSRPAPS